MFNIVLTELIHEICKDQLVPSWLLTFIFAIKGRTKPFPRYKETPSRLLQGNGRQNPNQ